MLWDNISETTCEEEKNEEKFKINSELLLAISRTLETLLRENKNLKNYKQRVKMQAKSSFSSSAAPEISLNDYLYRIKYYTEAADSTLIIGLIYIDRLCEMKDITLTQYNIHRILFASIMAAIKYNEDNFYEHKYYASIAGISNKNLLEIEDEFYSLIEFNLFVDSNVYEQYNQYLRKRSTYL